MNKYVVLAKDIFDVHKAQATPFRKLCDIMQMLIDQLTFLPQRGLIQEVIFLAQNELNATQPSSS